MNKQQNKQKIQTTHIYINISCKCDTNRAGYFTLDAYASRPIACVLFDQTDELLVIWGVMTLMWRRRNVNENLLFTTALWKSTHCPLTMAQSPWPFLITIALSPLCLSSVMATPWKTATMSYWPLTHSSLRDLDAILKMQNSISFSWLASSDLLLIMPSQECHKTSLMISQHWFRQWLCAIRQQAKTWTNVHPDLFHHMASIGHNVSFLTY